MKYIYKNKYHGSVRTYYKKQKRQNGHERLGDMLLSRTHYSFGYALYSTSSKPRMSHRAFSTLCVRYRGRKYKIRTSCSSFHTAPPPGCLQLLYVRHRVRPVPPVVICRSLQKKIANTKTIFNELNPSPPPRLP